MSKERYISYIQYYDDMLNMVRSIDFDFDCIVALKRSGWILGAYMSNVLEKPLFTYSEIDSIPVKFSRVLVVDDKICKGKSISKALVKLKNKQTRTACMYVEGLVYPDYYSLDLKGVIHKMWYESNEEKNKLK